jgi:2-keto-4-pentenoate hydratase/2-oxohepta-3-ene-1,7-dioic acid hydratase in catechol pathway
MRLVTFAESGTPLLGVCDGNNVVDVAALDADLPKDLLSFIIGGTAAQTAVAAAVRGSGAEARKPISQVRLLPPIPRPGKIICLGLNYVDHAAEGGHSKPEYPSFFFRCTTSMIAHGDHMLRPRCSSKLDYEAELVAVVGTKARHVDKADAHQYIAGYSCFNDGSIRDYQHRTAQWSIGKNFDATGAFGPWFVTADELPPGAAGLSIQSRLNGEVMQNANTRDMIFAVDETVQLLTECLTLEPGDLIVMGTPGGVGQARTPPVFMKHGDVIEIVIENIGTLRNVVKNET